MAPDFNAAIARYTQWVPDFQRFVPCTNERDLYFWMKDNVRGSGEEWIPIEVYTAIAFWKLYSTSRMIPHGLMTKSELQEKTQHQLNSFARILPSTLKRMLTQLLP